ncbi:laminin B domain-containing protein [Methanocrinis sp.]|uniref:laminin B domain-containing protein n=1 Tax=Methanocrinis sp. TaxID=3101522 RepID=UPI003D0E6AFC
MKLICALSSALLLLLGLQGSAQTLASTFDEGDEGWYKGGGAQLSWQRYGGDPGGFLQVVIEGDGWSCQSPKSWSGDWSRYLGGVLSFDGRLVAAEGPEPDGSSVKIATSDGRHLSSSFPLPERFWTGREVVLNASNFGVSEVEFRRAMRSVAGISIGGSGTEKRSIIGLDNVVVAPPSGLDLASDFDEGDGEWRPEGDVSVAWTAMGGNGGGFLMGEDLGDGSSWYYASPRSWSGDWTPYLGGFLSFDLKMIDSGRGGPYEADLVRIIGSDGSVVSVSSSEELPAGAWTRRRIALTPATFETTEEAFSEVMRSVDRVVIRGEYSDRGDVEGIDNVVVTPPIATDLVSSFDLGDEGWREGRDVSISWSEAGGNPGGYLLGEDLGSGQTWYYVSPSSWAGDWTPYVGGILSFELKVIDSGNGSSIFGDVVRIVGRDGSYLSWSCDPPGGFWTRRQVSLVPSSFREVGGSFDSIMKDVSEIWIRGEYSNMRDVGGLDNVMVTLGPEG